MEKVGIGIVGLGNISAAYLRAAQNFPILDIRAVADLNDEAARARADEFGLKAVGLDEIFSDPSVDIILNLTIPPRTCGCGAAGASRRASTSIRRSRSGIVFRGGAQAG